MRRRRPAAGTVGLLTPNLSSASIGAPPVSALAAAAFAVGALTNVTVPVDRTVTCDAGGSARTTGTLSGDLVPGGSGSRTIALTSANTGCAVASARRTLMLTADLGPIVAGAHVATTRIPTDPQTLTIASTVNVAVSGSRAVAIPCPVTPWGCSSAQGDGRANEFSTIGERGAVRSRREGTKG